MLQVNHSHGENVSKITTSKKNITELQLAYWIIHCLFTRLTGNFLSLPKCTIYARVYIYIYAWFVEEIRLVWALERWQDVRVSEMDLSF